MIWMISGFVIGVVLFLCLILLLKYVNSKAINELVSVLGSILRVLFQTLRIMIYSFFGTIISHKIETYLVLIVGFLWLIATHYIIKWIDDQLLNGKFSSEMKWEPSQLSFEKWKSLNNLAEFIAIFVVFALQIFLKQTEALSFCGEAAALSLGLFFDRVGFLKKDIPPKELPREIFIMLKEYVSNNSITDTLAMILTGVILFLLISQGIKIYEVLSQFVFIGFGGGTIMYSSLICLRKYKAHKKEIVKQKE